MKKAIRSTRAIKSIDIAKFLAAIMIIVLHTSPLADISLVADKALIGFCRIGVPLFFAMSSYLFFLRKDGYGAYLKKYVLRLCKYWVVYSLLGILILRPPLGWDILKTFLFDGFGVVWFFHGCIVAMSLMVLLLHINGKGRLKPFVFIVPTVLYICALAMNSYFSVLPSGVQFFLERHYYPVFVTARNGFFSGTIYMLVGFLAAKSEGERRFGAIASRAGGAFALFAGELFLSWNITTKIHGRELFVTMPLLIYCLLDLILVMNDKCDKVSDEVCFYLRKLSFALYGWQLLYIVIIPGTLNSLVRFVIITALSVVTGMVLIKLSKIDNKYVKAIMGYFI